MYQDFSNWRTPTDRKAVACPTDRRDKVVDPVGQERGQGPGGRRPEVVTDHAGPLDTEVVEHSYDVADWFEDREGRPPRGCPRPESPEVGDDDLEAGIDQDRHR